MSKCISSEGEYSDHEIAEQPRFMCARCFVFDEEAALAALDEAERERDVLGRAAFAAILASGEDVDGARDWRGYFRPLKHPSWVDAVYQNVTSLAEERDDAERDEYQQRTRAEVAEAAVERVRAYIESDPSISLEPMSPGAIILAALAPVTEEGDRE